MQQVSIYRRGFTLVEMIAVMLIVGVLAAAVVVRIGATNDRAAINQADQFRRNLSHIQMLALGWGVTLRLATAADGKSYFVTCRSYVSGTPCPTATSVGTIPIDPVTGEDFSVTLTDGVLISPAGNSIDFDSLGRPVSAGSLIATNPARSYTLSGGGTNATILLRPITGFAEAG